MLDLEKKQAYFEQFEKSFGKETKDDPNFLRIVSSNILHSHDKKSNLEDVLPFEERLEILAALYLYLEPDFIGVQELSYEQEPVLFDLLSEAYASPKTELGDFVNYNRKSPPYAGISKKQNHTPTLYRKDKYEVLSSRYHLMDVVGLHSYHWGLYRSLQDPSKKYIHMNLHFYPVGDESQVPGIVDARNELIHLRRHYPTTPIFVTGDYNMMVEWDHFRILCEGLDLVSGMLIAPQHDTFGIGCHAMNSTELENNPKRTAIDHVSIFTDLTEAKRHRLLLDDLLAKASDHSPIYLDVKNK